MLSSSPLEAFQQKPLSVAADSVNRTAGDSAPNQKVAFLLQMAERFERHGNVTEAIKSAETALLARKALQERGEADPSSFLEPMHKQALSVIQKCNGIAVGEFQNNRFDSALFLLNKALFLTSAAADTNCFGMHEHDRLRLRAATLNNLGCLEKRRENFKEALDYLQSAVEIETLVDPDVGASPSTCLNLCTLFNKVGKHDDAVAAAERAITALHFQAQQGYDNIPQFINMLMVAHYNMGVSVECTGRPGSIPKAIDAYARTVDIYKEHGKGHPSATADAAKEALKKLRAQQANNPVALPSTQTAALPPVRRAGSAADRSESALAHRSSNTAQLAYLKSLAPLSGGLSPRPQTDQHQRTQQAVAVNSGRPSTQPSSAAHTTTTTRLATALAPLSGVTTMLRTPQALQGQTSAGVSAKVPVAHSRGILFSQSPASTAILESAANLGDAAMKHASRMQAKSRRQEEDKERQAMALVKAQRAHKRDKASQQRREEELEAKRRDDMAEVLYTRMVESMRAEEVRRTQQAACKITAMWRGYITRRYMLILTHCTIKIQAVVRSALCRIRLTREKEEAHRQEVDAAIHFQRTRAAIVIQTEARRFIRRLAIIRRYKSRKMREYHSAKMIQEGFRDYRRRKQEAIFQRIEAERRQQEYEMERVNTAAAKIQGMFRAFKSRRFARLVRSEQQRRTKAAVTIQAQMRGCLTRQWFKHYRLFRREQEMNSAASVRSITKIQRVWRVALAKMRLTSLRNAAVIHRRQQQLFKAALTIQCAYRCHLAYMVMKPRMERKRLEIHSATAIQSAYRGFKARELFTYQCEWRRKIKAAKKIQDWFRGVQLRRAHRRECREAVRKKLAERAALKRTAAAMCIQTYCHTAITRRVFMAVATNYLGRATKAALIQSVGRMYLSGKDMLTLQRIAAIVARQEKQHAEMTAAALIIQRKVREYQAKCSLEERRRTKSAAIVIQSAWRMHRDRSYVNVLRMERQQCTEEKALLTVQRVGRGYLKQLELQRLEAYHLQAYRLKMAKMRREEAATQIQAQWRGVATRAAVTEARRRLKHAVIETMRIQRTWRAYRFRSSINSHIAYKSAQRTLRNKAAVKIQSFWRMVLAKEYTSLVREKRFYETVCAITIQCAWRNHRARCELASRKLKREQHQKFLAVQHDGWVQAVNTIVMHARTLLDQRNRLVLTEKRLFERVYHQTRAKAARIHMAATKIQSRYRGYYERAYVRGLRREKFERESKERTIALRKSKAAEVIQRAFRCMQARVAANIRRSERRISLDREATEQAMTADPRDVVKQLFWQHEAIIKKNIMRTQEERHKRLYDAATKIQSVVRMFLCRTAYTKEKARLARLAAQEVFERQARAKADADRANRLAQETQAAIRIQTIVRAFLVRRLNVVKVARRHVVEEEHLDAAAITIQSAWRGYAARCLATRLALEKNAQKDAVTYYEAARMIQKFYRGHMVRKRLGTQGAVRRRMSLSSRGQQGKNVPRPPTGSRPNTSTSSFRRGSNI